ncbi:endolytic transglycosylase MltG [Paenibacillus senegalensis]|uniref:endolytic transglycosylase MltG n=1 Tax=Paenibacillus senegalensis TaxID=1465766 RepID=UPI000287BAD3|nr:endolytic transglycosylase MltG [Paenibacillus senegalensis]
MSKEWIEDRGSVPRPKRRGLKIFLALIVLLLILVAAAAGYGYYLFQPMPASEEAVQIEIAPGSGSMRIAEQLEDNGIIRNSWMFIGYLRLNEQGNRFMAGQYEMFPGMTYDEIINKLNSGDTIAEETLRFTIAEGLTIEQIAQRLSEELGFDENAFLDLANKPELFESRWLDDLPDLPEMKYRLEGYLFPETYEMKLDSNPEDIFRRMINEWDRKLAQLPPDWEQKMADKNLDFHQLVTIASLIEREVTVVEERPLVAGVIFNRLDIEMPLQLDASVQYSLEEPKERLFHADLLVDSPYNTYQNAGLPPGPIAVPSLSSIEAVLYPEESKYLFYVTKKDGSQTHLFAETYEEHLKNIQLSQGNAN